VGFRAALARNTRAVLSLFLTCFVSLVLGTVLLLTVGHRVRFASRLAGLALGVALAVAAGEIAARVWHLDPRPVLAAEVALAVLTLVVAAARPQWNPVGQAFFASFAAAALAYLAFAAVVTFASGLPLLGTVASAFLLLLETAALVLSGSFTFEGCDVLCRARWTRPRPAYDPAYLPRVSLHVAAYNEPPDMLIETIQSLERLDYPDFEIVVIDNNTKDPSIWQPVQQWCAGRPRVRFAHADPLPGFKAGALNLALRECTDPAAELIGVVDADYLVDPAWLSQVVGWFADPRIAFVQTPQDYREYRGDAYLTACYDAFKYFFAATMPARNDRDSIIFAGTMGLLRRAALEQLGGWDEWCITEDAEASLRMLKNGWSGLYMPQAFGRGVMPLTFASLKSQRFRWCFGGMQILRRHWRELLPWARRPDNRLSLGQRMDYLLGGLQWLNDLVYLGFTVVLLATAGLLLASGHTGLRPLLGVAVLLPAALVTSGFVRAVWSLRRRTGIGMRRALLAFANWLSLSWAVALACAQGLVRSKGVFLRTPKSAEDGRLLNALWATRAETLLCVALWAAAALVGVRGTAGLLVGLLAWQGAIYACAPLMAWLNLHTKLSAQLERRRRTEQLRERAAQLAPYGTGAAAGFAAAAVVAALMVAGGAHPAPTTRSPFSVPRRQSASGPLTNLLRGRSVTPTTSASTQPTSPAPTSSSSTGGGPTTSSASATSGTTPTTAPATTTPTSAATPTSAP
jgi:cellulose synthase/poly-beta-1,6-N-acetylglucosamine synthase-like glycosyltransferase